MTTLFFKIDSYKFCCFKFYNINTDTLIRLCKISSEQSQGSKVELRADVKRGWSFEISNESTEYPYTNKRGMKQGRNAQARILGDFVVHPHTCIVFFSPLNKARRISENLAHHLSFFSQILARSSPFSSCIFILYSLQFP